MTSSPTSSRLQPTLRQLLDPLLHSTQSVAVSTRPAAADDVAAANGYAWSAALHGDLASIRSLGPNDPPDELDLRFWNAKDRYCTHCPRCKTELSPDIRLRKKHYMKHHYEIYFRKTKSNQYRGLNKWLAERIGAETSGARICVYCGDETREIFFRGRYKLLLHIRDAHRTLFEGIAAQYVLVPEEQVATGDPRVHALLRRPMGRATATPDEDPVEEEQDQEDELDIDMTDGTALADLGGSSLADSPRHPPPRSSSEKQLEERFVVLEERVAMLEQKEGKAPELCASCRADVSALQDHSIFPIQATPGMIEPTMGDSPHSSAPLLLTDPPSPQDRSISPEIIDHASYKSSFDRTTSAFPAEAAGTVPPSPTPFPSAVEPTRPVASVSRAVPSLPKWTPLQTSCILCEATHLTVHCSKYRTRDERVRRLQHLKRCLTCLQLACRGCDIKPCLNQACKQFTARKGSKTGRYHHEVLCKENQQKQ